MLISLSFKYSSFQYINQCWECVSERKHKREEEENYACLCFSVEFYVFC
jgi:hypothetical protein